MLRKKLASSVLAVIACATLAATAGCSKAAEQTSSAAASSGTSTADPNAQKVRIVTSLGTIVATLDAAHAPISVANFLHYVDTKFYNGGSFFRAVPGFVIQGGNKTKESPNDKPITLEDPQVTGVKNVDGALAMARTNDPNSATSEFFIDQGAQPALDGAPGSPGYAVFGNVISGMDVVGKIIAQPAPGQYLTNPIKIIKIERMK